MISIKSISSIWEFIICSNIYLSINHCFSLLICFTICLEFFFFFFFFLYLFLFFFFLLFFSFLLFFFFFTFTWDNSLLSILTHFFSFAILIISNVRSSFQFIFFDIIICPTYNSLSKNRFKSLMRLLIC